MNSFIWQGRGRALLLAAAVFLSMWADAAAQTKTNRMDIGRLQKRGDIYYHPVTNVPYTGDVYAAECEESDCGLSAGMRNGKFHGRYSWNDMEAGEEGNYKDGKQDGEWTYYSEWLVRMTYYKDGVKYNEWILDTGGWKLFDGNGNPTTINNTGYTSENGVLFNKNKTVLVDAGGVQGAYAIPNGVTIKSGAFSNCGLTSLVIPNGMTSIEDGTFSQCRYLESVAIPSDLTSLKGFKFSEYTNLTAVNVAPGNPRFASEGGVLFNKEKTVLIGYPSGKKDTSYKIPNGVVSIGKRAFYGCSELQSVTIPNSVTSIEDGTFNGLESIFLLNAAPPKLGGAIGAKCLYVPQGSVDAYRKANHWKDIDCINAISE